MTQREGLILSAVLLALVAITLPELGSDPWHFRPPSVDPQGLARAARARRRRGVGRRHRARVRPSSPRSCAAAFATLLLTRSRPALPRLDRHRAGARRRAPARRARPRSCSSACATPPRPWFFTNDSTYQVELGGDLRARTADNPYGHDYRALRARALLHARRQRVRAGAREARWRSRHFAYFPGAVAERGGLAPAARAVRRLPAAGAVRHARAAAGGAAVPRAARLAARAGRGAGVQPDRRALGVVRPERRAQPAAAGARLRARHAAALRAGPPRRSPARSC